MQGFVNIEGYSGISIKNIIIKSNNDTSAGAIL